MSEQISGILTRMLGATDEPTDVAPMVRALVEAVVFLAESPDDVVNPDDAVSCLEGIASHLLELREEDQLWLRDFLEAEARKAGSEDRAAAIAGIADAIGLAE